MKNEAIKWHVRDDLDAARMCSVEDYYFDTEAEATAFASSVWAHKTRAEKRQEGGITVMKERLHLDEDGRIADDEWNLSDDCWIEDVLTLNWGNDPENPANRQDEPDPDEDVFVVDYPQERVVWIYYNPDGNEARGQYVFNYVDFDIIREAAAQGITDSSKFFDYLLDNCQVKVCDRGTEAFPAAEEAFCNPKSIKSKGCTEAAKNLLVKVAFDEERKRERERLPGNPRHAEREAR